MFLLELTHINSLLDHGRDKCLGLSYVLSSLATREIRKIWGKLTLSNIVRSPKAFFLIILKIILVVDSYCLNIGSPRRGLYRDNFRPDV